MIILGAGMSGLLAAHMLRRHNPYILEIAPELPNNHAALLRFRTDKVAKETGIKFKKVWVQKAVMGLDGKLTSNPSIKEQNLYSFKVSSGIAGRSIGNLTAGERFIAPEDFISQLAKDIEIHYSTTISDLGNRENAHDRKPLISTIPMNSLMNMVGWDDVPEFKYNEIVTITADIVDHCDIYQTIYYPCLEKECYRASITGNKLIIECVVKCEQDKEKFTEYAADKLIQYVLYDFVSHKIKINNMKVKYQKYGKLINSTGRAGKQFVLAMTDLNNIYSLGRFATWRQILMDDVVEDVKFIERLIEDKDNYSKKLKITK